jgi:hypothetical protein
MEKMKMENTNWNFMLVANTVNGSEHARFAECHNAKSMGGHVFHEDGTKNVTVFDHAGNVYLYLVAGHPEKTVDVKSPEH